MGYQARHGGVTRGIVLKRITLEEARKRGHWQGCTSVRRYEKSGRLQKVLAATPPPLLQWGKTVSAKLADLLPTPPAQLPALPREVRSSSLRARGA